MFCPVLRTAAYDRRTARFSLGRLPGIIARFLLFSFLAAGLAVSAAQATPPLADDVEFGPEHMVTGPPGGRVEWPTGRINYLFEFDQLARFMADWQQTNPGPTFGGMIEAESGPLGGVIQTDNTLEAIWVWSRYTELTGSTEFLQNIADAWTYCQNYPAWLEEGSTGGYYQVHNCAWGLTAESAYRSATGDDSFLWYGTSCAGHIMHYPLFINQYQKLNAFVQGWAVGNLYLYGEDVGNQTYADSAAALGERVIGFIDYDPPTQLALETWAMSSGTMVWGLCNSTFKADPVRGQQWISDYGALVDTFQVWYDNPGDSYDWDNSWNVAYLNAHFAMGDLSGDPAYTEFGEKLTRQLLSYDTDDDGGIPATTQDPVTEDMSWVSCYLTKFGVDRMVGLPPQEDAGLLTFLTPQDEEEMYFPFGVAVPVRVLATNFGLQSLAGVEVHLEGPVTGSVVIDLPFVDRQEVELHPGWVAEAPGDYEFLAYTVYPGDEEASNDSLLITVHVLDSADVDGQAGEALALGPVWPNPSSERSFVSLRVPAGAPVQAGIFSVDGREVASFRIPGGPDRVQTLEWDGLDANGRRCPAGIYLIRAMAGSRSAEGKLVRLQGGL